MPTEIRKGAKAKRASQNKAAKPLVLIVCEGSETEPNYFEDIRRSRRIPSQRVKILSSRECKCTDPQGLVKCAKEEVKKSKKDGLFYDVVWIVFDRDEHTNFEAAIDEAERQRFSVCFSIPSFELWFLLHFREQRSHLERNALVSLLTTFLPDYEKSAKDVRKKILPYQADAVLRAKKLGEQHEQNGVSPKTNPSTEVHKLVLYLEGLS